MVYGDLLPPQVFKVDFIEASKLSGIERQTESLRSPACIKALGSYRENIRRHMALLALPGYASLTAHNWATAQYVAQTQFPGDDHAQKSNALMAELMQGSPEQKRQLLVELTQNCENFMSRSDPVYEYVLETVLKAVVILSWGTFETLVADLYRGVTSENPSLFNLTGKPAKFMKREFFREAYSKAFPDDPSVQGPLLIPEIDALCALRNVLAHSAGIVDKHFQTDRSSCSLLSAFDSLQIGSAVRIDGLTVVRFIDPVIESGYTLIEAVDAWLKSRAM